MNIECNQRLLSNKISIVQKAISSKSTMELLKCIYIETKNGEVLLRGYDLEVAIETTMSANIVKDGKILVNAKLFGDIVRKLSGDIVKIYINDENNVCIESGNSKFQIRSEKVDEYPQLPEINDLAVYEIEQSILKEMIRQTVFATSMDQSKPLLMGELLEIKDNKLSLVAIDGYRFAARHSNLLNQNEDKKVIVPGKTLSDVLGILEDGNVKIGFSEKHILFVMNEVKIISRLLEGDFIEYKKLIPREYDSKIKLNTKDFLNAIERASILAQAEKNSLIKLNIRERNMLITSNSERGNVVEELSVDLEGGLLDIAFNSRYLIEALKVIDSEELTIEFTSNVNPCIMKPNNEVEYIYLLLPVRMSNIR